MLVCERISARLPGGALIALALATVAVPIFGPEDAAPSAVPGALPGGFPHRAVQTASGNRDRRQRQGVSAPGRRARCARKPSIAAKTPRADRGRDRIDRTGMGKERPQLPDDLVPATGNATTPRVAWEATM